MEALEASPEGLRGVGKASAALLAEKADARCVFDLLTIRPSDVVSYACDPLSGVVRASDRVLIRVTPYDYRPFMARGAAACRIACKTRHLGTVYLVFFRMQRAWLEKLFPLNEECGAEGKIERYGDYWQLVHPEKRPVPQDGAPTQVSKPFYSLGQDIPERKFLGWLNVALNDSPPPPEWLEASLLRERDWPDWRTAVVYMHRQDAAPSKEAQKKALDRLAYDELLCHALALKQARAAHVLPGGAVVAAPGNLMRECRKLLPFTLTRGQEEALGDVLRDLRSDKPMMRLLQGDVGSGKTVVALLSMLQAAEAGMQSTLMAPTELLARQHYAFIGSIASKLGLRCALIAGSVKGKRRAETLAAVAEGEAQLVVGTHAAFQDDVVFRNQAYVVIDEQHRFGVGQRLRLAEKTGGANALLMSATPIPRSLTLAIYGDVEVSRITEKPAGRKPIETRAVPVGQLDKVVERIGAVMAEGQKVYWICPLVSESEVMELSSAEERHARLQARYGDKVGLLHGKITGEDRERVMAAFKEGELRALVATTVVEVGVDVPDATVIVIEHAERFGLSQLHQLRGRVGRGALPSRCLLLYGKLNDYSRRRLDAMRRTDDGFLLAEEDLKLRGAGDVLGTQQSGLVRFRIADLFRDRDLVALARRESGRLLAQDPHLSSPRGALLKRLMRLFRYEEREGFFGMG
jgi:ATP-dependent DNA helicase RecG